MRRSVRTPINLGDNPIIRLAADDDNLFEKVVATSYPCAARVASKGETRDKELAVLTTATDTEAVKTAMKHVNKRKEV